MNVWTAEQSKFNSITYQVNTPEGVMFVLIMEDNDGNPIAIQIFLGKAGGLTRAWAESFSSLLTLAIQSSSIEDVIEQISAHRSDAARTNTNGVVITNGPEGVAYALMRYKQERYEDKRKKLKLVDDDDEDEHRHGTTRFSRMARRTDPTLG